LYLSGLSHSFYSFREDADTVITRDKKENQAKKTISIMYTRLIKNPRHKERLICRHQRKRERERERERESGSFA
jgi:hypothetical protein